MKKENKISKTVRRKKYSNAGDHQEVGSVFHGSNDKKNDVDDLFGQLWGESVGATVPERLAYLKDNYKRVLTNMGYSFVLGGATGAGAKAGIETGAKVASIKIFPLSFKHFTLLLKSFNTYSV